MIIPKSAIPYTYTESRRVFENNLSVKEAAGNIHKKYDIKINSCGDYAYYFRYLMTGNGSCRILSSYTQEYYLKMILDDYGNEQLKKSLINFKKLIEKFEGKKVGSKKSMNATYEKYLKLV